MSLDIKRKEIELMRVQMAKEEMKFRVAERMEELERLHNNITIQEATEQKLEAEIKTLKGE